MWIKAVASPLHNFTSRCPAIRRFSNLKQWAFGAWENLSQYEGRWWCMYERWEKRNRYYYKANNTSCICFQLISIMQEEAEKILELAATRNCMEYLQTLPEDPEVGFLSGGLGPFTLFEKLVSYYLFLFPLFLHQQFIETVKGDTCSLFVPEN